MLKQGSYRLKKCLYRGFGVVAVTCVVLSSTQDVFAQVTVEQPRQIEEIIVTAEKRQSTVSDTSIAITAFSQALIEDLGIQSADELVNYLPATTRDDFDIRIRGVGRNFRALGGDPGIATYTNGVYAEDFGPASTENDWFDLERVEVLRGPQGTLYGRNSIGGALNFITNKPTYEWEGTIRTEFKNFDERQFYGVLSGPLVKDKLAFRAVYTKFIRDEGFFKGLDDGPNSTSADVDTRNSENYSLALNWRPTGRLEANLRWHERDATTVPGQDILLNEGAGSARGQLSNTQVTRGLNSTRLQLANLEVPGVGAISVAEPTPISPTDPSAIFFTDPRNGATLVGAPPRAGVDPAPFPSELNPALFDANRALQPNLDNLRLEGSNNDTNELAFTQNSVTLDITWDINDLNQLKYIGGYSDFRFTQGLETDSSGGTVSSSREFVDSNVQSFSHELQLNWSLGSKFVATSGLYFFSSDRNQIFDIRNQNNQGRFTNPVAYNGFSAFVEPFFADQVSFEGLADFQSVIGLYNEGDPLGRPFILDAELLTEQSAAYTQGTYQFNEQFALTLGVRWARDRKSALEQQQGYFEQPLGNGGFLDAGIIPALDPVFASFLGGTTASDLGLTPLAAVNVLLGAATPTAFFTSDPVAIAANPIIPTCGPEEAECATPLRLTGIPLSFATRTVDDDVWRDITGRVNLAWTPNEDTLVYASVTSGYRAGGYSLGVAGARDFERDAAGNIVFAGLLTPPFSYDPETVVAYELGYKGQLAQNTLQLNATLYSYNYSNYQDLVNVFDPVREQGVEVVQNAPSARNIGFELEATWLATAGLTLGGNYSYTSSKFDDDFLLVEFDNPEIPLEIFGPLNNPASQQLFVRNVNGNRLKRIPEHKSTLWAQYVWQTTPGRIQLTTAVAYTGKFFTESFERRLDRVPSRIRVDMAIRFSTHDEKWVLRGFVDNLFNSIDVNRIDSGSGFNNFALTGNPLAPRRYGIDIARHFGGG